MGWDITYHPVSAAEIQSLYFRGVEDPDHYLRLVEHFGVDDFYAEQLRSRFAEARELEDSVPFNKGHAFYLAIVLGFLRKHHYIRGGAFSFLVDNPVFSSYISDLRPLVPERFQYLQFDNRLTENYCGGVFISFESLKRLRSDYESDAEVRQGLDEAFSHGRLQLFWRSVDAAVAEELGLLEAAEVVEPFPLDLNRTRSLTNLFNCHPDGALLYAEAAAQQLAAVVAASEPLPTKKRSIWSRLFG